MKPEIMTTTNKFYDYLEPDIESISIVDIAHSLSNICRFNGQCRTFYSVAQHSVLVSHLVPRELALEALMHDAAEAYVGDVPTPLKNLLHEFRIIEQTAEQAIKQRFNLGDLRHPEIKKADLVALATEERDLFQMHDTWDSTREVVPNAWNITPLSPKIACLAFMSRYSELRGMQ